MWWKRKKPETIKIETPYGKFLKIDEAGWSKTGVSKRIVTWTGTAHYVHGNYIDVTVDDIEGVPNPRLLGRLPTILTDLQVLDRIARDYPQLGEQLTGYEISSISDCSEEHATSYPDCFTLGYDVIDDGGGEAVTVFVDFSGRDIVDWAMAD